MATPKVHLFLEDGGMVTGTHDVAEARRLIAAEWLETHADPDNREDIADASRFFRARDARLETGRIVPESPANQRAGSEYAWFWRRGYKLGTPGVTKAVVWS